MTSLKPVNFSRRTLLYAVSKYSRKLMKQLIFISYSIINNNKIKADGWCIECLDGYPQVVGLHLVLVFSLLSSMFVRKWLSCAKGISKDLYLAKHYKPALKNPRVCEFRNFKSKHKVHNRVSSTQRKFTTKTNNIYEIFVWKLCSIWIWTVVGTASVACFLRYPNSYIIYLLQKQIILRSISHYSCTPRKTIYTGRKITPSLRSHISHIRHATC